MREHMPYNDHMGFRMITLDDKHAVMAADVDKRMHNPMGVLHGGVLTGLADSAMGSLMTHVLAPGDRCTNVDIQIRFLRPIVAGRIQAEARFIRRGRTASVLEATVREGERVLAVASSTFLTQTSSTAQQRS